MSSETRVKICGLTRPGDVAAAVAAGASYLGFNFFPKSPRYLDISDAIMAQGSMRCDVNVSIRPKGETELGTRTELKNINSFRFVERAIRFEIERQIDLIEDGGRVIQVGTLVALLPLFVECCVSSQVRRY